MIFTYSPFHAFTVGEIKYKDAICQGEQDAIIERSVWDRVKGEELNCNFNEQIITNLARAFRWQALIDSGKFSNVQFLM